MRRLGCREALARFLGVAGSRTSLWMSSSIRYTIRTSIRVAEYDKAFPSPYICLVYQVVDGDSEPKKFYSKKIPLTHGLIVIEDGREEEGLLVSGRV